MSNGAMLNNTTSMSSGRGTFSKWGGTMQWAAGTTAYTAVPGAGESNRIIVTATVDSTAPVAFTFANTDDDIWAVGQ
jgi:hypothetical protein